MNLRLKLLACVKVIIKQMYRILSELNLVIRSSMKITTLIVITALDSLVDNRV